MIWNIPYLSLRCFSSFLECYREEHYNENVIHFAKCISDFIPILQLIRFICDSLYCQSLSGLSDDFLLTIVLNQQF